MMTTKFNRPSWDTLFMRQAADLAEKSTCIRKQVGAILVKDNRPISLGYNGTPKGDAHCCDHGWDVKELRKLLAGAKVSQEFLKQHGEWSKLNELHAERNAILYCARRGIATEGATLYITLSPCHQCAMDILIAGIKRVVYGELYDRETSGIVFLSSRGVQMELLPRATWDRPR